MFYEFNYRSLRFIQFLKRGISASLEGLEENDKQIAELITGRQVELAEEMKYIKNLIALLQKLTAMLKNDY